MMKRAVAWLRQHREARILIVGSCDSGGSETCTRGIAEGRGAECQQFNRSVAIFMASFVAP
jgi:hypothetical protein